MKRPVISDPFAVLQIESTPCRNTVRAAFRAQARKWHPDRNPDDPNAPARFQQVVSAYEQALRVLHQSGSLRVEAAVTHSRPTLRFVCGQCGDSFQYEYDCPLCGVATADTQAGEQAEFSEKLEVTRMCERLINKKPPPEWFNQQNVCRTAASGLAGLSAAVLFVGLPAPALGLVMFAVLVAAADKMDAKTPQYLRF